MNKYLKITMDKAGLDFAELFLSDRPIKGSYEDEELFWQDHKSFLESKGINYDAIKNDSDNLGYHIPMIYSEQIDDLYFVIPVLEDSEILKNIVSTHPNFVGAEVIDKETAIILFNDWILLWYQTQSRL